jgi:hypothetical protein
MESAMTPVSNLRSRDADPINGGGLVFGAMLTDGFQPSTRPFSLQPKVVRAPRPAGRLRRLLDWWIRPLPAAAGPSADASTRLEILIRGGLAR